VRCCPCNLPCPDLPAPAPAPAPATPAPKVATPTSPSIPVAQPPVATVSKPRPLPPDRWHFDLGVRGQWSFPLDGAPSAPAGELALGYHWSRWGVELRAGIADDWGRSVVVRNESVGILARRIPLSLALTVAFPVRGGAIRLQAGPLVALWLVHPDGATRGSATVVTEAGLSAGASYRLHLSRMFLEVGVQLDVAFTSDRLTIVGAGLIAQTPIVAAAPYLGGGVRF